MLLRYALCGIPSAIGVAFVASYGFTTSDDLSNGIASAFLFGMIAAGAFGGPLASLAVANTGRKGAAVVLALLTVLAIVGNWTNTLGAIANRSAGTEAEYAKLKGEVADNRAELRRITAQRDAMSFAPVTDAAVTATQAAIASAERTRAAECGNGDPRQRGLNCRQRETEEQVKRDTLATVLANKAATDRAAILDNRISALQTKIAKAPAVKDGNALGETLGGFLSLSAGRAASLQQGLLSALVELLIAAIAALPELLRPVRELAAERKPEPDKATPPAEPVTSTARRPRVVAGIALSDPPRPAATGSVAQFMIACMPRGGRDDAVALRSAFARYQRWCGEQAPPLAALEAREFAKQFKACCARAQLHSEMRGDHVYCLGVRLVA
jgi:predicted lipid-binding transport protein (Tim44 family)